MVKLKKVSKRQTLKQKYAIIKKVAAHKRKLKKIIKKTNIHNRRTTKRSLKIPECIFKKNILNNIKLLSLNKKNKNKEEEKCKEVKIDYYDDCTLKNVKYQLDMLSKGDEQGILSENVNKYAADNLNDEDLCITERYSEISTFYEYLELEFCEKMKLFEKAKGKSYTKLNEKYMFIDILLEVIKNCDILFYLVDVRNPLIYVDKDIIDFIHFCKKEVIIVLNKCDLVDNAIIQQWLVYFRKNFITIPFISFSKKYPIYLANNNKSATKVSEGNFSNLANGNSSKLCIKNVIKKFFNKHIKITYGVIGNIYTGRSSFMQTLLNEFSYPKIMQKHVDINVDHNINIYTKRGLILKKNLNGIELIKKLHALSHKEKLTLLSDFLLNLSGKNFKTILKILNEDKILDKYQNSFVGIKLDKEQKKEIKKEIIQHLFLSDQKEHLKKDINFDNMKKLYNKIFLNKVPYYIIPKTQLTCVSSNNHDEYNIIRQFDNIKDEIYHKIDEFIFSQKKKFKNYIIVKSDMFNFYN
ncbi:nucleolar preribosomal GTPase [Plasmodium brasilianum]|uniref:Nucleolar preribosomal GTPase, putative n=2 Tax=Plasmodium (Plasmodium) TaxID=418103 RepID=A0A1A8X5M0_PLAMA|nr:nucleolar preribosomal GTPase, putative [Plasmodium malariae]KAI4837695.1 nucleolar preribosomal GTPase [Plasmodium brasilianum]SBT00548.1 nucleolar preribosomal GTPase, putative [Plasmodium malariae]SCN44615.1 nucleolar preribosomal GTPase, putative [Plasmodium malariae]